jgi:hypothetical protein
MTGLSVIAADIPIVNGARGSVTAPEEPFAAPPSAGFQIRREAEARRCGAA